MAPVQRHHWQLLGNGYPLCILSTRGETRRGNLISSDLAVDKQGRFFAVREGVVARNTSLEVHLFHTKVFHPYQGRPTISGDDVLSLHDGRDTADSPHAFGGL